MPTCGKFGKLISSGGRQNFAPNLRNFLTRRKHRKQRRRLRSHLYAFTVFRPVCTKFKWQSTPQLAPPAALPIPPPPAHRHRHRRIHCTASVSCLPLLCALVAYLSKYIFFLWCAAHCIETCGPLGNPLGWVGCSCLHNLIDCLISLIDSRIPQTSFDLIKFRFYLFRATRTKK